MLNSVENDIKMAVQIAEKAAAFGGTTYYVGGCVRDELMKQSVKDIDNIVRHT